MAETYHSLRGASVVWADYKFWLKFFQLNKKTNHISYVNDLICSHFAYISEAHLKENLLHDLPQVNGQLVYASRPSAYRRSSIRCIGGTSFDVKGTGLPSGCIPSDVEYGSGLQSLPSACNELFAERIVDQILLYSKISRTSECLAIICIPIFTKLHPKSDIYSPSAILVRRSHRRPHTDLIMCESKIVDFLITVELQLRKYGVTSCAHSNNVIFDKGTKKIRRPGRALEVDISINRSDKWIEEYKEFDLINVQICFDVRENILRLVDFEHFNHQEYFQRPLCVICERYSGRSIEVIAPEFPDFVVRPTHPWGAVKYLQHQSIELFGAKGRKEIVGGKLG